MTDDEMVGWHHRLDGHESEQVPEVSDGQGSLESFRVTKSQTFPNSRSELNWNDGIKCIDYGVRQTWISFSVLPLKVASVDLCESSLSVSLGF